MLRFACYDKFGYQDFYQKHPTDVGYDLRSAEEVLIYPGEIKLISTGLYIKPYDSEYSIDIRSRSGLTLKGLVVLNAPGTIDPAYSDEVKVIMANFGDWVQKIAKGDRIAQMVIHKIERAGFVKVNKTKFNTLSQQDRNGGFGSSGVK